MPANETAALSMSPLVVPPREACRVLSIGLTRLYELLNGGELDSFLVGRSRRISLASIHAYIASQRALACGDADRDQTARRRTSEPPNEIQFAQTADSMGKVVETMTTDIMQMIANEIAGFGCQGDVADDRLQDALYAVIARNVLAATARRLASTK